MIVFWTSIYHGICSQSVQYLIIIELRFLRWFLRQLSALRFCWLAEVGGAVMLVVAAVIFQMNANQQAVIDNVVVIQKGGIFLDGRH